MAEPILSAVRRLMPFMTGIIDTDSRRAQQLDTGNLGDLCPGLDVGHCRLPDQTVVDKCLADVGVHQIIRYRPADRFWTVQLIETGILLGLAAAACGVAVWGLTRRTA